MKNPQYNMGMTYEEYRDWHEAHGDKSDLFAPPGDPKIWSTPDGMRERIQMLKEYQPRTVMGHVCREMDIQQAEERLKYLLHLEEQKAETAK